MIKQNQASIKGKAAEGQASLEKKQSEEEISNFLGEKWTNLNNLFQQIPNLEDLQWLRTIIESANKLEEFSKQYVGLFKDLQENPKSANDAMMRDEFIASACKKLMAAGIIKTK